MYYVRLGAPHLSEPEAKRVLRRLHQVIVQPSGTESFAEAALRDPKVMAELEAFSQTGTSRIDPWKPEEAWALASHLGVPCTQNVPEAAQVLGRKSGARALFHTLESLGVHVPKGSGHLVGVEAVADYIHASHVEDGGRRFIVKLDNGQAGAGNAMVVLPSEGAITREQVGIAVANAKILGHAPMSREAYEARLANPVEGGVVESFLEGELREASVKVRLTEKGDKIIGVHMQRMGQSAGSSQSFVGGVAPADSDCAPYLTQQMRCIAAAVRDLMATAGETQPHLEFGVDFLITGSGPEDVYASEINLRHTGMSPTDWIIQYVVGARFDSNSGALRLQDNGEPRFVQTRDWLTHEAFGALKPEELIGLIQKSGLHFDPNTKTGVVVQAFEQAANQRVPVVCVGKTPEDSERLLGATLEALAGWLSSRPGASAVDPQTLLC